LLERTSSEHKPLGDNSSGAEGRSTRKLIFIGEGGGVANGLGGELGRPAKTKVGQAGSAEQMIGDYSTEQLEKLRRYSFLGNIRA